MSFDCPPFPDEMWSAMQPLDGDWGAIFNSDFDLLLEEAPDERPTPLIHQHHDCMWTGLCGSREHNDDVRVRVRPQQSLLKPIVRVAGGGYTALPKLTQVVALASSLHTPPMSDDEEPKPITQTLQNLHDAIFENVLDDDGDLSDYFKDEEDFALLTEDEDEEEAARKIQMIASELMKIGPGEKKEEEEEDDEEDEDEDDDDEEDDEEEEEEEEEKRRQMQIRAFHAAESDHSYHKGNLSRLSNLGVDTPSDSDSEIDVVNIDKSKPPTTTGSALPHNPSRKDRHQLQRTMQSRFPQGIKTILPVATPTKPRAHARPRPAKPKRPPPSPPRAYKRRSGHSSDSDQEPSEKRSLHNNMERQRRIDLRNLFEDLKALVPEVNKKQRAAKVMILRGAAAYCRGLTQNAANLGRQADELRKYQERLRGRVSHLRKNLAAAR